MIFRLKKYFEAVIVSMIIFSAIFISKYPTLHNALNTPSGLFFTKQSVWFDAWDINAYVSYIRYGQRNGVLLENTYTTIPHPGVFVFQTYTLLGVLNRYLNFDPFLLFHLASTLAGIGLILIIYYTVRIVFQSLIERISALSIIVLGAGLGWINNLNSAADFRLAGFTLVDPLERPHNALTTLFVVAQVAFLGKYINSEKTKYLNLAILSAFITFTIHPPLALLSCLVFFTSFLIFRKKSNQIKFSAGLFTLLCFYLIYYLIVLKFFISNPGFKNTGQVSWIPDLRTYIMGFGSLTIGIVYAFLSKNKSKVIKLITIINIFS